MPGYLVWLNARLFEMKRLLKDTGSIYVHCDWHASHYIKVEMDKIFGFTRMQNEIVWHYRRWTSPSNRFQRLHDILFFYTKSDSYGFNQMLAPYTEGSVQRKQQGVLHRFKAGEAPVLVSNRSVPREGVPENDVWQIPFVAPSAKERIGYPTQKPEALLERIISASSSEGDVVGDFFAGGGTTASVAQRLGRRWIACDQSRVAISVTAERLKQQATTRAMSDNPIPDFTVEHWGIYEAERLSSMPVDQFREFVLRAWGATRIGDPEDGPHIHGWRNQLPIWVGDAPLDHQATPTDVETFANAVRRTPQYQQANLRDGVMLAWGFRPDAAEAAEQLRQQESIDVNFVRLQPSPYREQRFP